MGVAQRAHTPRPGVFALTALIENPQVCSPKFLTL